MVTCGNSPPRISWASPEGLIMAECNSDQLRRGSVDTGAGGEEEDVSEWHLALHSSMQTASASEDETHFWYSNCRADFSFSS